MRTSDPCYMGQHDRCMSPYCRCEACGCAARKGAQHRGSERGSGVLSTVESSQKDGPESAGTDRGLPIKNLRQVIG